MEYKNFITRIDDRLIHGQVNVGWIKALHIKQVFVVDNDSYKDEFLINLWSMSVDKDVQISVFDQNRFIKEYVSLDFNNTMLLLKNIENLYNLVIKLPDFFKEINIGGLHYEDRKMAVFPWFFVSEKDIEYLNKIVERNINIYIQMTPGAQRINVDSKFLIKIEDLWQSNHA